MARKLNTKDPLHPGQLQEQSPQVFVWNLQQQQQQQQDIFGVQGDLSKSDTKIIAEVTTMGAEGNLLRKKRIRFKSTAGFKVFHKMEYLKIMKE